MIKRIMRYFSYNFLSFFLSSSFLFSGISPIQSAQLNAGDNVQNSLDISIEKSTETKDSSNNTSFPDLGDEQAFPFIPGFGKNSGKD